MNVLMLCRATAMDGERASISNRGATARAFTCTSGRLRDLHIASERSVHAASHLIWRYEPGALCYVL